MDNYTKFVNTAIGKKIVSQLGLPSPSILARHKEGDEFLTGNTIVGAAPDSFVLSEIGYVFGEVHSKIFTANEDKNLSSATAALQKNKVNYHNWSKDDSIGSFKAVIFDASGISKSSDLISVYYFFNLVMKRIGGSGRVVIIGRTPENCPEPKYQTAQRGLIGFVKALGKELRNGATANLVYVDKGAEKNAITSIQFFASNKSTYVSGQFVKVSHSSLSENASWDKPLLGKTAIVTGAARGIGEAIAKLVARDGAKVICLDVPQAAESLNKVAEEIGGIAFAGDITAEETPQKLGEFIQKEIGKLDIIIHNAGITRDKLLANMKDDQWKLVMNINLSAEERINDYLLAEQLFNENGRIICVSSISGISGNRGQTNYAASKAAVIGMVDSMAPILKDKNITINAVAPGFIETQMTAAIPTMIREAGRRMNSMAQGGQPEDVAETIAYFANPNSAGLNGNVVRVCGQGLIGA